MEPYTYIEHTADLQFIAYGKNLEEALRNSIGAVANIIADTETIKGSLKKSITIKGQDLKAVIYNLIEEMIYLLDAEQFVVKKASSLRVNHVGKEYWLTAVLEGDTISDDHELKTPIKAATYNDMFIKEEKEKVTIQCVVDI